jgi:hypothetical protein
MAISSASLTIRQAYTAGNYRPLDYRTSANISQPGAQPSPRAVAVLDLSAAGDAVRADAGSGTSNFVWASMIRLARANLAC